MLTDYKPGDYQGLISLQNNPKQHTTGFNNQGYERFMLDKYTIVNKEKQAVPFEQQPAQQDFLWQMTIFYELLILKARKMGFSSTALGVGSTKFLTGQNEKCVSMSFDQSSAQKQLQRAYHYIKSYEIKKSQELNKEFKVPFKNNSKNELVWEGKVENDRGSYDYFQNALRVGTAGVDSFGRGDDITFLHLTEVSLAKDIPTLLAGVGEACVRGAHKILETTANGYNTYKNHWDDAMRLLNDFAALFYSPLWEYTQEEVDAAWRRLGRLGPQEFPLTPQMAFLTSGETYFDNEAMRFYNERTDKVMA
jgi:hypothetical protein